MMSKLFLITAVLCLLSTFALGQRATLAKNPNEWELVWADEFSGSKLDLSKWAYEIDCAGGGNKQLQCYTPREKNVRVSNGSLIIEARVEKYSGTNVGCTSKYGGNSCTIPRDYTSGRIRTKFSPTGSWTYGRFEIKAQLPNGRNLWPALWMLPTKETYGSWAASGEIDILEARGQRPHNIQGTLHYGAAFPRNRHRGSGTKTFPNINFQEGMHLYALEWDNKQLRWYIDSTLYHTENVDRNWYEGSDPTKNPYTKNGQPWDHAFHFVFNVAVGGAWFPETTYGAFDTADALKWPNPKMVVDYARVFKKVVPSTTTAAKTTAATTVPKTTAATTAAKTTASTTVAASVAKTSDDEPVDTTVDVIETEETDETNEDVVEPNNPQPGDDNNLEDLDQAGRTNQQQQSSSSKTAAIVAPIIIGLVVLGGVAAFAALRKHQGKPLLPFRQNETPAAAPSDPDLALSASVSAGDLALQSVNSSHALMGE